MLSVFPIYLVSEIHASKAEVGFILAAFTVASVIIRPFTGFTLERYGRKYIFVVALFFYALIFWGYLAAFSVLILAMLRFLQGATWGVTTISGATLAADIVEPTRMGEGLGYFAASTTLGMSVGPIVGLFICHHFGYLAVFISCIVFTIASLLFVLTIKLPKELSRGRKDFKFEWSGLFDKSSVSPSINLLILMTTYGALLSFIALYGREIGIQNSSYFFFIFAIGIAVSRFTVGKAFDKNGPRRILHICLSLLILTYPLLALVKNEYSFYTSALLIGFGNGVVFPIFQAIVNNLAENGKRGAANSTLYTALDIGMTIGMVGAGLIAQYISISSIFLCSSVMTVLGLAYFQFVLLKNNKQGW
jgi:MFS family permease